MVKMEEYGQRGSPSLFFLPVNITPSFQVNDSSLLGPAWNTTNDRPILLPLTFQLLTSPLGSKLIKEFPE